MIAAIDRAREAGDTLGGAFEVIAHGVPVGLGSYVQWDRKLDGRLAQAMMSIPAIKASASASAPRPPALPGSRVHDEIVAGDPPTAAPIGVSRPTNNAGGLEGGVTNGEELRVTGLHEADRHADEAAALGRSDDDDEAPAAIERSDVCAVPAAAVVGEAMVALVLADALLEKFGGDSIAEIDARHGARPRRSRALSRDAASTAAATDPMIRPILEYGDAAAARARRRPCRGHRRRASQQLIDDMIETMYAAPGIGLAAPQVGVPLRIFVVDLSVGRKRERSASSSSIPEFVERDGMQLEEEGCLSVPGFNATVARPSRAVVRGSTATASEQIDRRHGPAGARVPARDGSPRRHAVRRSPARHQARPHRPQDPEADDAPGTMVERPAARSSFSARRRSRCRRSTRCSLAAPGRRRRDAAGSAARARTAGRATPVKALALAAAFRSCSREAPQGCISRDASRAGRGPRRRRRLRKDPAGQRCSRLPRLGMINVHASLLPKYRGAAPVHRAVIAGDESPAVTIMRVVKELDAGAMLAKVTRPIGSDETSVDVERGLADDRGRPAG